MSLSLSAAVRLAWLVASCLSEDPSTFVLLLEGRRCFTANSRLNIPIFYAALFGAEADWNIHFTPQVRKGLCLDIKAAGSVLFQRSGLNGRILGLNQRKVLGGSSALNARLCFLFQGGS